ncbi:type II toxin-antitoxin system RelB/DinJ family antitoxin [Thiomicrorhabdus sp. 6S2-11]|uniref:Type II toxin-antitoxin system RelB/DinJ family antitoxin n=1 Tax=Thiomicrorhabdus marina TaxID=2818442 RepID=A0ABS3Q5V9_9GAMM|nr:type II toxin-antitoxin system RelB/DinJ family antitoxin [Thiomicrorhabdus marina]MBO1927235.1 type II toxin-antitoxin system RelB/DinJ family antitoxin [Thiomicrorhabdus marina]
MKVDVLTTRIDHDTKIAFNQVCQDMGLTASQAIKLFAKAVINHGGIPFEIKASQPNLNTQAAINELNQGQGQKIKSLDELGV